MNMPRVSAGRPTIELIKSTYRAGLSVFLFGLPGIGKSEMMRQAAAELNVEFIVLDLSLMEPPDLTGLPEICQKNHVTMYRPPNRLPRDGAGLLVLEELNRCERYMRAPCLQLLTARRLNDYNLPSGWLPTACANPPNDAYDVFDLDPALLSRFVVVEVVANRGEWLRWAREEGLHSVVLEYVQSDPDIFTCAESNPRAWTNVSQLFSLTDSDERTLRLAVEGLVGSQRAAAFFGFLGRPNKPLSAADMIERYSQHKVTIQSWLDEGRVDLVRATLSKVLAHLQAASHVERARSNPRYWKNLGRFFEQLPGDLRNLAEEHLREHGHPIPGSTRRRKDG